MAGGGHATATAGLPGASGTNGVTTRTPEVSLTVTLNGQPLVWHVVNASDATVRSGLSGYTQWIAFQWDTSALNPAGQDNVLTFSVSSTQGDLYDALRMELTNTAADPAVTGWHDYEFLYKTTDTKANDAVVNP